MNLQKPEGLISNNKKDGRVEEKVDLMKKVADSISRPNNHLRGQISKRSKQKNNASLEQILEIKKYF